MVRAALEFAAAVVFVAAVVLYSAAIEQKILRAFGERDNRELRRRIGRYGVVCDLENVVPLSRTVNQPLKRAA